MWSFFSRDPIKDFHYDVGETISGIEGKSIWSLHHGKKKGTGELVSIFAFDVKGSSDTQLEIAKSAFKRVKTLRHPSFLTFLDGIETDKVLYIVTEQVVPLETYIHENEGRGSQNLLAISWGLHQISKGLSFLINDCQLIHNNVCMASVFVDQAGEWKIGGVDYMYPAQGKDSLPPIKILPMLERYDPPEKKELSRGIKGEKWSSDMWGLGCLIWEVFNGTIPKTSSLKNIGKIPKNLVSNYCELVGANPKSRPNPAKFITTCRKSKGFMQNMFVNTMLFLEEIQMKDQAEKNKFFGTLSASIDTFPNSFCRHKILPQLLHTFDYGNAGSAILAPLFKLGKLLETEEYQKKIVPCVVKLFSSPDRATRVKLLQQLEFFAEHLQVSTVNDQIFPHLIQGFVDTNPMVRESTIKAMLHLAPKLNYKNMNEELMKQFARLQMKDEQGGIRTNTTICLGKIGGFINPQTRSKILISAFLRAMKDPFPPARQAGILAMASTQNYYLLTDISLRLLPALCAGTMDPEKSVRDQAFKAIRGFLAKLEKVSEDPEAATDMEKDVHGGGTVSGSSSWAGWAVTGVSSLTSKIYSKATTKTKGKPALAGSDKPATPVMVDVPQPTESDNKHIEPEPSESDEGSEDQSPQGWDENNWGDMDDVSVYPVAANAGQDEDDAGGNEDDAEDGWNNDWGTLEDVPQESVNQLDFAPVSDASMAPTSSYNWGQENNTEDFFSSALGVSKTKAPTGPKRPSPARSTSSTASSSSSNPTKQTRSRQPTPPKQESSKVSSEGWDAEDDVWGEIAEKSKPRKPSSGGAAASSEWGDTGGWGAERWEEPASNQKDDVAKRKAERDEKRLAHQKGLQEKRDVRKTSGALKLGAKKFIPD